MELRKNKLLIAAFAFYLIHSSMAKAFTQLPVLKTKQSISNIRYLSTDGKYTYYQRRTGELYFSTNYEVKEVLKGPEFCHYTMHASYEKKKMIVAKWDNFQRFFSVREPAELFVLDYGKYLPRRIGTGIAPRLHLNDTWVSFYDTKKKKIIFQNLINEEVKLSIDLSNSINHYFIPEVLMPSSETILYTDIDQNGIPIISSFNIPEQKFSLVFKPRSHLVKLELCMLKNDIIVGEFGLNTLAELSVIKKLPTQHPFNYSQSTQLYESKLNDIGNLICHLDNKIYFSKKIKINPTIYNYEIASLDITTKNISILSDLKYAHQAFAMEDKVIIPHRGEFLLLVGKNIDYRDGILGNKK